MLRQRVEFLSRNSRKKSQARASKQLQKLSIFLYASFRKYEPLTPFLRRDIEFFEKKKTGAGFDTGFGTGFDTGFGSGFGPA